MPSYGKTDTAIAALTPEQHRATQQNGTERPGSGRFAASPMFHVP